MRIMRFLRKPFVLPIVFAFLSVAGAAACAEGNGEALRRIETAYRLGVGRASTPAERFEALRTRAGELDMLVELSYQSTLSWLAETDDLLDAVVDDQERWLDERRPFEERAADETAPLGERSAALDRSSELAMARLRTFATLTSPAAFTVRNM